MAGIIVSAFPPAGRQLIPDPARSATIPPPTQLYCGARAEPPPSSLRWGVASSQSLSPAARPGISLQIAVSCSSSSAPPVSVPQPRPPVLQQFRWKKTHEAHKTVRGQRSNARFLYHSSKRSPNDCLCFRESFFPAAAQLIVEIPLDSDRAGSTRSLPDPGDGAGNQFMRAGVADCRPPPAGDLQPAWPSAA